MANFNSDQAAGLAAFPPVKVRANVDGGRKRYFERTFTCPAAAGPGIGDTITWGTLPVGALIVADQSTLSWGTGTASCTLNLGDAAAPARHLAATSVATAGAATATYPVAGGPSYVTTDASNAATNDTTLISTVAGAIIKLSQVITLRVAYVCD